MSRFSATVTDFWHDRFGPGEVLRRDDDVVLTVNPALRDDRRVMLLELSGGPVLAALTPAVAAGLDVPTIGSASDLRRALGASGISLHGADHVFYFDDATRDAVLRERPHDDVRRLATDDEAAFARFRSAAPEQDLDDAYVELDHWAVVGAFAEDRLACAASAYPWEGSSLADLGVLTLPDFRGRGLARRVVRAISRHALEQGHEPQYRCQLDNAASIALARAAGLTEFGTWDVAD